MQREIGIIIKVKDAAKAKQEIQSIFDNKILGGVTKFKVETDKAGDSVSRVGKSAQEASGSLDKMFRSAAKGAGIFYTLKRSLSFAMGAFEEGAGLERAGRQFESSVGKINEILPQLRTATRGTVEDMKLLQTANRAVMEGLNPRQLTKMYQMATVASRKLGLETEQSIQTISNAIVRQDESALTTLGTILKTNIGLKVQNALIAKNGGVMSGAMALQIRQSVIMGELNKRFGGFNKLQEDGVEILEKFRSSMSNLRMSIGQALGTALTPLLKVVSSLAQSVADFLNAVKDNSGFKAFIQYATVLAGIFTTKKLLGGIMAAAKYIGMFTIGLKGAAAIAAGFIGFKALGGDLSSIAGFAEKAQTAFSGFFQLISNYDAKSGMTSILKKDKDALGGLFTIVFQAAKGFILLKAAVEGVLTGIGNVLRPVVSLFGEFGNTILDVISSMGSMEPLSRALLQRVERLGQALGSVAAVMAGLFGASALRSMYVYFTALISQSAAATAQLWLQATAWAAANPLLAAGLAAGAGLAAVGYAAYKGFGSDEPTQNKNSDMNRISAAQEAPAIRNQNVEASSMSNEVMMSLFAGMDKKLGRIADSNEQINVNEQQKSVNDSVRQFTQPLGTFK